MGLIVHHRLNPSRRYGSRGRTVAVLGSRTLNGLDSGMSIQPPRRRGAGGFGGRGFGERVAAFQVGVQRDPLRRVGRFEVNVHLLTDVEVDGTGLRQGVDDLKDTRVNPFRVRAGQALLGDHVGLDVLENQRKPHAGAAFERGQSGGVLLEPGEVVLVDVDADVELLDVAEDDHRLFPRHRGELAEADVELEDFAVGRRDDGQAFETRLDVVDLT